MKLDKYTVFFQIMKTSDVRLCNKCRKQLAGTNFLSGNCHF